MANILQNPKYQSELARLEAAWRIVEARQAEENAAIARGEHPNLDRLTALQQSQPAITTGPVNTPINNSPLSSTQVNNKINMAAGSGNSGKGAAFNPLNNVFQSIAYHSNFPEEAVKKAQANKDTDIFSKGYVNAYNDTLERQETLENIKDQNNPLWTAITGIGAGVESLAASVPNVLYAITHVDNLPTKNSGSDTLLNDIIPNIVTEAQTNTLQFGSQLVGGALAGGVVGGSVGNVLRGGSKTTIKGTTGPIKGSTTTGKGNAGSSPSTAGITSSGKTSTTTLPDTSLGLSPKQIGSTALTNKDSVTAIPGTVTHTLTKGEIALRNSVGDAFKGGSRDLTNKNLITISQETAKRNAAAPVTLNVADVTTKFTGIKESQQSGFAVSIKPATVNTRQPLGQSTNFIKSKPKDITKRAGKTIVDTLQQSNKPTLKYSAGPSQREIILQWDPSQNVYMKLKENGNGRYDYIGDLTSKQIDQLSKLDLRKGGGTAKQREYAILSESGYVRPEAKPAVLPEGKYFVNYKNDYGFNVEVSNGKYKYTLVDQLFHKENNFPNEIKGNAATKIVSSIENGKDIQLKSAYERFTDFKNTPEGKKSVNFVGPAFAQDFTATPLSNFAYAQNPFAAPKARTIGPIQPGLSDVQLTLRNKMKTEYAKKSASLSKSDIEYNKQTVNLREGIESELVSLPDGLKANSVIKAPININVKVTVNPVTKETFKLTNSQPTTRPKTNGVTTTKTISSIKSTPTVRPRATTKSKQQTSGSTQQVTQDKTGFIGKVIIGTTAGVGSLPIATAIIGSNTANAVIDGTNPVPIIIPPAKTVPEILDATASTSTSISTSSAISTATDEAISDSIADSIADAATDTITQTYDMTIPVSVPAVLATILAIPATGTTTTGNSEQNKQPENTPKETKRRITRPVRPKKTTKKRRRVRVKLDPKADKRIKRRLSKKPRKYVQIENYIPWLDDEDEITKKWYMIDAKLMRTTKKITPAIKKAIEAYNKSAKTYNEMRKKLLNLIKKAGRTVTGKKAATQLRKLYRDTKQKRTIVAKVVKQMKK